MSSIKATNRDMVGGARQRSHTSSTTVPRGGQADEDLILASISAAAGFWSSAPDLIFYLVASLFLIPELFDLISSTASSSSSSPLLLPPLLLGSYKRHNCGGIVDLLKCLVLLSGGVSMSKLVAREDGGSQLHVLAVDDSSLDRKLIERLLKSSAYRGELGLCCSCIVVMSVVMEELLPLHSNSVLNFAVTTVDSGKRALELLGVGSKSSNKVLFVCFFGATGLLLSIYDISHINSKRTACLMILRH